jgi:hypothetical protein
VRCPGAAAAGWGRDEEEADEGEAEEDGKDEQGDEPEATM